MKINATTKTNLFQKYTKSNKGHCEKVLFLNVLNVTVVCFRTFRKDVCMVYGYARVSTFKQNIERQCRNILAANDKAIIVKEVFTGTKFQGRKELDKIVNTVKEGDTIIFDSVSRMSRNAEEGFSLYEDLFNQGINLVFLKEPQINTDTYKNALQKQVNIELGSQMRDAEKDFIQSIMGALNKYTLDLAKEQIRLAFNQSEKEVVDLHQRTKEGIETARLNGQQIGLQKGAKLTTKKSNLVKDIIRKRNKTFGGDLNNEDTRVVAANQTKDKRLCKATFYKYKRELMIELEGNY